MSRVSLEVTVMALVLSLAGAAVAPAQVLPNPYRQVDGWATLPGGRTMGAVGGVTGRDPLRCDRARSVWQRVPRFRSRSGGEVQPRWHRR